MHTYLLIRTSRLRITELTPGMAKTIHRLSLDSANRRFLPDEVFRTADEAAATIDMLMAAYDTPDGPYVYPVRLAQGTQIGHVEAAALDDGAWEIGYHIGAAYAGHGYATEAVTAFLPVIARRLGVSRLMGVCVAENAASRRVMEKTGFVLIYEGDGMYQGHARPICRYVWEAKGDEDIC